jgi:hypothetical protein
MKLTALIVSALLLIGTAAFAGPDLGGNWETNVFGSVVKAKVQQDGINISGVANVYNPFGKKDVYHFKGTTQDGRVNASHHSGHSFVGTLTPDGRLVGVLNTKTGTRFDITARRR